MLQLSTVAEDDSSYLPWFTGTSIMSFYTTNNNKERSKEPLLRDYSGHFYL